jgi:hypothetical protein
VGILTCRLIELPSILYHASLNSRACFVCARPNSSVSVQLKVYGSCRMCVLQVVIYNRIVLWRFCVQLFVFQFSSRFDLYVSLWTVSARYHVYSIFCLF